MIPAALAILIYQILAILGTEAVNQIVTSIAYAKRDLDFKLMYTQSPLDLLLNYSRFDKKIHQKAKVVLFVCLSIALKFIPTIFTKISSTDIIYYDTTVTALDDAATTRFNWPSTMPVFDNFTSYLNPPSPASSLDMKYQFTKENLLQNTTRNSKGYWFEPQPNTKPFAWDNRQAADSNGFTALNALGKSSAFTFNAFGSRNGDWGWTSSATLNQCVDNEKEEKINDTIFGLEVSGVFAVSRLCYPIFDPTLPIIITNTAASSLSDYDRAYRQPKLSKGTLASSSFGVNIFNHNSTHMTMGIKKSAHITLYSYKTDVNPPSNCSSDNKSNFTNNFIDLPYNAVLCDLIAIYRFAKLSPDIVQAVGRQWVSNYAINTVYTLKGGNEAEPGDSVMIDFTMLQAFTVEGNLPEDKEYIVAYESKSLKKDEAYAVDLSNDKIGSLLKEIDPMYIDQATIDFLVGMASMKVRYENGDFSDFNLYQAQVLDAVSTPLWWSLTLAALVLVFLLPQASRLIVRRIPEYSKDLRSLLLLTIERTHAFGEHKSVKNVGIVLDELNSKVDDRVALLAVNGYPVAVGENPDKSLDDDTRFLNEELYISKKQ